ncbi:hypothetical protein [Micromonospora nigra]|nr:hypothetical protein [Micromonospora nigra]
MSDGSAVWPGSAPPRSWSTPDYHVFGPVGDLVLVPALLEDLRRQLNRA